MPVDMNQAKSLFLAVLEMPVHERAAFLETHCGADAGLRQRVEAMLQADEASGELLPRSADQMLAGDDATAAFAAPAAPAGSADVTQPDADVRACLGPSSRPGSLGRLGHYEIQEVVGQGGFGTVFKAFDEKLHRVVAIKVLAPAFAANGSARKRFIREARTAAAVKNEHVVGIYDVEEEAQPPYLAMEMIDGLSLQDKLDKHGPLGVKEILRIGLQMAEGLAAAHKQGLVHRDIKPANILLENGVERVKITDFGLARAVDDASVTQSGTVAGTPMYMSPEQAEGLAVDHRSDLFSLGTVLYAMCTGHPPFRASGTHAVLKRVIDAAPRPIREINDEIPDWLCAIIAKLHAKKPEDRFQTAKEVAELLERHLAHLQRPAQVAIPEALPAVERGGRTAAKGTRVWTRRLAVVASLLFVLAVVTIICWATFGPSHRPSPNSANLAIDGQEGIEAIVIRRGDAEVVRLNAASSGTVLQPGTYDFEVVSRPGYKVKEIRIESTIMGLSPLSKTLPPASHFSLNLGRRESAHILITMAAVAKPDTTGWVPVFNSKDLAGWEQVGPAEWTVRDGLLRAEAMTGIGWLATTRDYTDFELKLEYRMAPGGNSGVFLRAWKGGQLDGGQFMEIQLIDDNAANTFGKDNGTGAIFKVVPPTPAARTIPNTWHKLAIKAQGRRVQIVHDGQQVIDANLDDHAAAFQRFPGLKKTTGRIGLQNFDSLVEFRKIEIKELPPPATPFVVLAKDAKAERKFATLAEAVAAALSGDTIEIRGDGPFASKPIDINTKDPWHEGEPSRARGVLTIRAGKGFRPVLTLDQDSKSSPHFLRSYANLILEGLELRRQGLADWDYAGLAPRLIHLENSELFAVNCRFVMDLHGTGIFASGSKTVHLRNCEYLTSGRGPAFLLWANPSTGSANQVTLENCTAVGGYSLIRISFRTPMRDAHVKIAGCTAILERSPIWFFSPGWPLDNEKRAPRPMRFETTGSVFKSADSLIQFNYVARPGRKPISLADLERILPKFMSWRGVNNAFNLPLGVAYTYQPAGGGREQPLKRTDLTLAEWKARWGSEETGAESKPILLEGKDVLLKVSRDPSTMLPQDLRLDPKSPGGRLDGKDLGADVDRVGPGEPYEKWKTTPEYQEWRKQTDTVYR